MGCLWKSKLDAPCDALRCDATVRRVALGGGAGLAAVNAVHSGHSARGPCCNKRGTPLPGPAGKVLVIRGGGHL